MDQILYLIIRKFLAWQFSVSLLTNCWYYFLKLIHNLIRCSSYIMNWPSYNTNKYFTSNKFLMHFFINEAITNFVENLLNNFETGINKNLSHLQYIFLLNHSLLMNEMKTMKVFVEVLRTGSRVTYLVKSRPLPLTRGVPQGLVLDPILFILFKNNLPEYLHEYDNPNVSRRH